MFVEKLTKLEIENFLKNQYIQNNLDYVVKSVSIYNSSPGILTVNLRIQDKEFPLTVTDSYTLNDFDLLQNKQYFFNIIPQLDYFSFMYNKFGEEYLTALKTHLENEKQQKIKEIDRKNNKIIEELTK